MAGQLTLGGGATGLPGGQIKFGEITVASSKGKPELQNIELEAGTELKVKLPPESTQYALGFEFQSGPPTLTIKTNVAGDGVMTIPAIGFFSAPIAATATELAFKAAVAPKSFQLYII